ncbi:MAG TPA: ubiquinone biosynthesis hydroxylase [Microvirga sp.]|jgi:2-octaprenyl-6-methoxyphenol hydroxylase
MAPIPNPPIVIAGGGLAGLSLALALKRAHGDRLGVVMADPALRRDPRGDKRAYAIAAAARRMLQALGVWDAVAANAQPILDMVVTDSRLDDPVRPAFLTFDGVVEAGEPFAHMIEGGDLTGTLVEACRAAGVDLKATGVTGFRTAPDAISVELEGEEPVRAALLVAADGARSKLRSLAGIGWIHWPYKQSGIVATVAHERDHEGRAVEHFLPSGPFAILPLRPGGPLGHRSSIVWTERGESVPHLLGLEPDDLLAEVERRFGLQLGRLALETKPQAFPLSFGVARTFVGERLALLGDAAHVIHPIAGQGLNLGFHDAAALAEVVTDALRLGLDPGAADTLDFYERARRLDITAMGAVTDGLNRLFSNDVLPVRLVRDLGLGLVDRVPALKRFFIREAAGLKKETPRLLKGEAL